MTTIETTFSNMTRANSAKVLMSMDKATDAQDVKLDEIISYNEKGEGFAPYHTERAMIKRMVRKGLVIETINGFYAVPYLCNLSA